MQGKKGVSQFFRKLRFFAVCKDRTLFYLLTVSLDMRSVSIVSYLRLINTRARKERGKSVLFPFPPIRSLESDHVTLFTNKDGGVATRFDDTET